MAGVRGQYVRRYDSLGRMYVVPRAGGQRVKHQLWYDERAEIARARKEAAVAAERGEAPSFEFPRVTETGGVGEAPFPPSIEGVGVSEVGVPEREVWIDEDGVEWDLPEAVQGDDDTG